MSTVPPPAYSAVGAGEGNNPPPSYNASAPAQPPAYNPSAPSQAPVQVQPTIKYVDQNGNPVAPPVQQPAVKYVDQYGNPVAPPVQQQQQPAIRYVDQHGNPVAPPVQQQPAIKYVDQHGNPVAAPVQAQPQPAIKYVDQHGNPVQPPVGAAAVTQPQRIPVVANQTNTTPGAQTTPGVANANGSAAETPSQRQQKVGAAVMGALGTLLLFIGLCVDKLTTVSSCYTVCVSVHCGWTTIHSDSSSSDTSFSYGDWCDISEEYCGTQAAAAISLVFMLVAFILAMFATIYAQPWKQVTPCCCKQGKPARTNYAVSVFFSILSIIAWSAGDQVCSEADGSALGGSHICQIIAIIFNIIALVLAKN
eukprot:CAMPEP_0201594532 /NCGR_PEP_ID=MMETSP0190_2-20130828/191818_1 /ASSEMBLY_ACC=CAM_ASM_000263 /TAXON_ID=37353 /ORGANISM="Rosalina sp." /LENGTH=362 /DNA_ID=CAMNT_0048054179 /DNA_START=30 /DNA_END=1118 /DNA_ORIENTATION=+